MSIHSIPSCDDVWGLGFGDCQDIAGYTLNPKWGELRVDGPDPVQPNWVQAAGL